MKALLIISHGSRRSASNAEVFQLADRLREESGAEIEQTACAFLEIAEPKVQAIIDELAAAGASNILVLLHFLAAGMHVSADIPRELEAAGVRHPGITFSVLPHLGALPGLSSLVLDQLEDE